MATIQSINSQQNAIAQAQAERQVQRTEEKVQDDAARLRRSEEQLASDQRQLEIRQEQTRRQAQAAGKSLGSRIDTFA